MNGLEHLNLRRWGTIAATLRGRIRRIVVVIVPHVTIRIFVEGRSSFVLNYSRQKEFFMQVSERQEPLRWAVSQVAEFLLRFHLLSSL
jgi:hypothetical protein